ncbi:nucleotide sugar dehydrogenase [Pontibacter harenae]|uniref:nucleotide sugar dehydrogenase n=1 Tax=Pontibacter harenae TaxID=2894083 RepID=UPI001E580F40|nr:nucleotide sugar dehydrogenase [Pontibacter harenae]MCC9168219.1 nucleotide sugar dehydrogenase [Pontibacter harenae]
MHSDHVTHVIPDTKIAVIGLGYVGLPLAIEFAKKYSTVGFEVNEVRLQELIEGKDRTLESNAGDLTSVIRKGNTASEENASLQLTSKGSDLRLCNTFIVTVPTPLDKSKTPDLKPLLHASELVGSALKPGDLVVYESTVYPGCTEEDCVPVLERVSGLVFNKDFFVGYSPERINPGDPIHKLTTIKKLTSGSTPEAATRVDNLYASIIEAGTFKTVSIKVAEASKAIENAQRDINISFMNELALIFDKLGIDTQDVLEAARTKWNFVPFSPGLVGGHCIGVDPYYLAHKAQAVGYHPEVILSGRRVNDNMGSFVANKVIKLMINKDIKIKGAKTLILGFTFKENCPDVRNTRVVDIYQELIQFGLEVDIVDPWANIDEVLHEYDITIQNKLDQSVVYDAIVVAVAHNEFLSFDYKKFRSNNAVIFDTKACLDRSLVDGRL